MTLSFKCQHKGTQRSDRCNSCLHKVAITFQRLRRVSLAFKQFVTIQFVVLWVVAPCKVVVGYHKIYKTIILPIVLYGCETWTVTVRECLRTGC